MNGSNGLRKKAGKLAQLGVGSGSSYPTAIDSRQVFVNGSSPQPDSNSRIDSEFANDALATLIAIETVLGANVQGTFGSLAARLNQFIPGSGGQPGIITFTNAVALTIPGTQHNVGQAALLWQLYDNSIPAHAISAGNVSMAVNAATYDVQLTFAFPTSGSLAIGVQSPIYVGTFSNASTVSIPGTTHQLGTSDLLFQLYDNASPMNAFEPGSVTVDQTSHNMVIQFGIPLSGTVVLSAASPAYAVNFTNAATLSIPGSVHQLGTAALFFQAYDDSTPRAALGDPDVSVHPSTFDVEVNFGIPVSGRFVLGAAATISGRDFDIRDGGIVNANAVRMRSQGGALILQPGSQDLLYILNKLGNAAIVMNTASFRLGVGIVPDHQLQLGTDDAVKPSGGAWLSPCDTRVKQDIEPFTDSLETLLALADPIRFRYNGLGGMPATRETFIGLSAQDVQARAPYLVRTMQGRLRPEEPETDLYYLDATPLPFLLMNCVKALHAQLAEAREASALLRQQMEDVTARLVALESKEAPAA